jgi:SAM-dependent methyltransferase
MHTHLMKQRLRRLWRPAWFGTLHRTSPLSDHWGTERGTPIDRYYIERFLAEQRADIRGRVLEVKDSNYTNRFGTGVTQRDVLDVDPANAQATIIADLSAAEPIPSNAFDCFILTQTLQFIYDTRAALAHAHRILRPGGVLLVTVPSVSQLDRRLTDYWRFTVASCQSLFGEAFGSTHVTLCAYGNVLTAISFLMGLSAEDLSRRELDAVNVYYPVVIAVRAMKRSDK